MIHKHYSYLLKTVNCAKIKIDWSKFDRHKYIDYLLENNSDNKSYLECQTLLDFAMYLNGKILYGVFDSEYYKIFDNISSCLIWDDNIKDNESFIYFNLNNLNIIWCLNFIKNDDWAIKSTSFRYTSVTSAPKSIRDENYLKYMFTIINSPEKFNMNRIKLFL